MRRVLAGLLLAACGSSAPAADGGVFCEITRDIPIQVNRDLDLLFVVDRSASMAGEQAALAANVRTWAAVLESTEGGLPNLHVGVVSADADDGGDLLGCPDLIAGAFLSDFHNPDGTSTTNYSGAFADAFACQLALGAAGAEITEPLAAARLALAGNPRNAGFLRDNAFLGVIFVTDEDDCSAPAEPADAFACTEGGLLCAGAPVGREPAEYADCAPRTDGPLDDPADHVRFLRELKADPSMVIVSAVVGPPAPVAVGPGPALLPSCSSAAGEAAPAVRLAWLLEQFPNRNIARSICQDDYAEALLPFVQMLAIVLGVPCLGDVDPTDLDPSAAGLQIDCSVTLRDEPLPRCSIGDDGLPTADAPPPCWWVRADPASCPETPGHLVLEVEQAVWPGPGTHIIARCAGRC